MEHKLARSGTYEVKFFDEESYSILRKVRLPLVERGDQGYSQSDSWQVGRRVEKVWETSAW